MSKLTLEEKKLERIRMQLFGKERPTVQPVKKTPTEKTSIKIETPTRSSISTPIHENSFVRQDLLKVALLSTILIGSQFVLYYLSIHGIVNLNVFHIF